MKMRIFDENLTEDFTFAHRCSNRAINFIEKFKEENFFLTVSYDEPHGPSLCPAPYNRMFEGFTFKDSPVFSDDLSKKPFMQQLWAGDKLHKKPDEINVSTEYLSTFLGCNSFVDYEIGRVLDVIYREIPDALVIFTSDHGDMLGAHRLNSKNATMYKEVANIPLIVMGGEKDKVITEVASHIDIVPTILDYFEKEVPITLPGKSMLTQIYDVNKKVNDYVFTEFTRYECDHDGFGGLQMMRGIVSKRYKLAINLLDSDEFYDMQEDPDEVNNLILDDEYARIRDKMHDELLDHMNETRDLYRGYQWAVRPWRTDKLPTWMNEGYTRQPENEPGEYRQLDYDAGLTMVEAVRNKAIK